MNFKSLYSMPAVAFFSSVKAVLISKWPNTRENLFTLGIDMYPNMSKAGDVRTQKVLHELFKEKFIAAGGKDFTTVPCGGLGREWLAWSRKLDTLIAAESIVALRGRAMNTTQKVSALMGISKNHPVGIFDYDKHEKCFFVSKEIAGAFAVLMEGKLAGWMPVIAKIVGDGKMPHYFYAIYKHLKYSSFVVEMNQIFTTRFHAIETHRKEGDHKKDHRLPPVTIGDLMKQSGQKVA